VREQAQRFAAAPPEARVLAQLSAIRKAARDEFAELIDQDLYWEKYIEHEASVLADARNFAHDTAEPPLKVLSPSTYPKICPQQMVAQLSPFRSLTNAATRVCAGGKYIEHEASALADARKTYITLDPPLKQVSRPQQIQALQILNLLRSFLGQQATTRGTPWLVSLRMIDAGGVIFKWCDF
jgi:hypothetical protein